MNRASSTQSGQLHRLTTLGGLLGIKTSPLAARLAPLAAFCDQHLTVTVPFNFDAISATTRVPRATAQPLCGPWLDGLPGDELDLEVDIDRITATSDDAALPTDAPAAVTAFGTASFASLGLDGTVTTYAFEQPNPDDAAIADNLARVDTLAASLGVTAAQRKIAASLLTSLARNRPHRLVLRAITGTVEPTLGIAWDDVEWRPIQSMLGGFYPNGRGADLVARLSRNIDAQHATVELLLGRTDPPGMRISFVLT